MSLRAQQTAEARMGIAILPSRDPRDMNQGIQLNGQTREQRAEHLLTIIRARGGDASRITIGDTFANLPKTMRLNLSGITFPPGTDFSNSTISGLSRTVAKKAILDGAILENVQAIDAQLQGSRWNRTRAAKFSLTGRSSIEGAKGHGTILTGATINAAAQGVIFTGLRARDARFAGSNMDGSQISGDLRFRAGPRSLMNGKMRGEFGNMKGTMISGTTLIGNGGDFSDTEAQGITALITGRPDFSGADISRGVFKNMQMRLSTTTTMTAATIEEQSLNSEPLRRKARLDDAIVVNTLTGYHSLAERVQPLGDQPAATQPSRRPTASAAPPRGYQSLSSDLSERPIQPSPDLYPGLNDHLVLAPRPSARPNARVALEPDNDTEPMTAAEITAHRPAAARRPGYAPLHLVA